LSEAATKSPAFEILARLGSWVALRVPESLATVGQVDRRLLPTPSELLRFARLPPMALRLWHLRHLPQSHETLEPAPDWYRTAK
jgi:hypothetical protein